MAQPERNIEALLRFVDSRQRGGHAWGRRANDWCSFVIDAIEAQTGRNPAADLSWSNRAGALRVIKRFGSLEAAFDHYLVRIPPAQAMRGDIAGVADEAFGIHPMLVEGELLAAPGDKGLRRLPRRAMVMAWSAVLVRDEGDIAHARPSPGGDCA